MNAPMINPVPTLDPELLRRFVAIVNTASFSAAARSSAMRGSTEARVSAGRLSRYQG